MVARRAAQECAAALRKAASYVRTAACTWVYVSPVWVLAGDIIDETSCQDMAGYPDKNAIAMVTTAEQQFRLQQPTERSLPSSLPCECH